MASTESRGSSTSSASSAEARGTGRSDMREQEQWAEHAHFMNALVDDGFILLGGPVEGGREAFHVVDAASEDELRARFAEDPWARERDA